MVGKAVITEAGLQKGGPLRHALAPTQWRWRGRGDAERGPPTGSGHSDNGDEIRSRHERARAGRQCWWGSGDLLEKVGHLPWAQAGVTTRESGGSAVRHLEGGVQVREGRVK